MVDDLETLKHRIRDLEACLFQSENDIRLMALTFSIPPGMARLLGLLRSAPVVTPQMADERIGLGTDLKVAMHRLRKYMQPHGVAIQSQYMVGYWVTVQEKERISRLIRAATSPAPGHTDLMAAPETIDDFVSANSPPADGSEEAA